MLSLVLCLSFLQGFSQEQRFKGYPLLENHVNIREGFLTPPKGYGNVPFIGGMEIR